MMVDVFVYSFIRLKHSLFVIFGPSGDFICKQPSRRIVRHYWEVSLKLSNYVYKEGHLSSNFLV